MKKHKRNLVNKSIVVGLMVWLLLGTGLAAAGTLTVSLQPGLDGNGTILADSLTKAELLERSVDINVPAAVGTVADNTVLFNLSVIKPGDYYIRLNNRSDYLIPTLIDDPTKDISQFVGRTLRVSVIGNLSDPVYIFKTYFNGLGPVNCSDGWQASPDSYIKLSLKTDPQKLEVNGFEIYKAVSNYQIATYYKYIDYTPTTPNHPSTSTSTNQPFSKWVFSHGADYNGNDSKCSNCHGNLNTKPASFSDITVNNGFCYRCHYARPSIPAIVWLVQEDVCPYHPHASPPESMITPTPTATPTQIPTPTPKTPAFEALPAIAVLLMAVLVKRR
jgi:hypothetical protein